MPNIASKVETLNLNTQFRRVYSKGKSCVRSSLVVYARPNGLGFNRLGVTVSKKVGKAVVRNRAKRRLREVFRKNQASLGTGFDLILVARGRTPYAAFSVLDSDFTTATKTLGVFQ